MDTVFHSAEFNEAFNFLLKIEGKLSNDPVDRGGLTKWGISSKAHPDLDVEKLTLPEAKYIYWERYWLANQCDRLPPPLAYALFDGVVNHRAVTARKLMQDAIGVRIDGVIGEKTCAAAMTAHSKVVLVKFFARRAELYHSIILNDSRQSKFKTGWFRRLFIVQQHILEKCWPWPL